MLVNELEDFPEIVIRMHLIATSMTFFSVASTDDEPHSNLFPVNIETLSVQEKKKLLFDRLKQIICRFVEVSDESNTVYSNPHSIRVHSEHNSSSRSLPNTLRQQPDAGVAPRSDLNVSVDGVLCYGSVVLVDGCLLLEFKDAIREGDGDRIVRCWKVLNVLCKC